MVEAHGVPVAQDLDVSVPNELAQLALAHPVMFGHLGQGQRRIAGTEGEAGSGCGGSHRFASLRQDTDQSVIKSRNARGISVHCP